MSKRQKLDFLDFVASPYFNRQPRLLEATRYLLENSEDTWTHESLHEVLYRSAKPYRKQAVYDALSQLQTLLERFLSLQQFEQNSAIQQEQLLEALTNLQAEDGFWRQWRKQKQYWERFPHQDLQYLEGQYGLHRNAAVFAATRQRRDQDEHLGNTILYLELSYWVRRLKLACEVLNRRHILSQEPVSESEDSLTVPTSHLELPAVHAYWLIYEALRAGDDEMAYLRWTDWLDKNSTLFAASEVIDMYNYAQNYCVRKINQGQIHFLERLFTLYAQLEEKELLLDQFGMMDHRKLKNMVTVGIRLNAFEWADEFLHRYRDKLIPDYREDAFGFNLASLRYAQKRHSEALTLLQQVEFRDVFYWLSAKTLLIRIYYETAEDLALSFQLENLRLYLHRNRLVSSFQRKVHHNLLRFTRKLLRLREQRDFVEEAVFAERLASLEQQLERTTDVANLSWLKAQIVLLKGDA
ncbi:MAG: hypothetical protein AAFQ68_07535 [Bacteroidota bacterium]